MRPFSWCLKEIGVVQSAWNNIPSCVKNVDKKCGTRGTLIAKSVAGALSHSPRNCEDCLKEFNKNTGKSAGGGGKNFWSFNDTNKKCVFYRQARFTADPNSLMTHGSRSGKI